MNIGDYVALRTKSGRPSKSPALMGVVLTIYPGTGRAFVQFPGPHENGVERTVVETSRLHVFRVIPQNHPFRQEHVEYLEEGVCCHTHHKMPGEPCGFHGSIELPCAMRQRHFKSQLDARAKGKPPCEICGSTQKLPTEEEKP